MSELPTHPQPIDVLCQREFAVAVFSKMPGILKHEGASSFDDETEYELPEEGRLFLSGYIKKNLIEGVDPVASALEVVVSEWGDSLQRVTNAYEVSGGWADFSITVDVKKTGFGFLNLR